MQVGSNFREVTVTLKFEIITYLIKLFLICVKLQNQLKYHKVASRSIQEIGIFVF